MPGRAVYAARSVGNRRPPRRVPAPVPFPSAMRPVDRSAPRPARIRPAVPGTGRAAAALIAAAALALPVAAAAQQAPGSFSLPEPGESPAPAPQGPVDIREGVVIGPRVIAPPSARQEAGGRQQPERSEAREPARPAPTPSPARTPAPRPAPAAITQDPTLPAPADRTETATPENAAPYSGEPAADTAPSLDLAPGFDLLPAGPVREQPFELRVHRPALIERLRAFDGWIVAGLLLLVALLLVALLVPLWLARRRRKREVPRLAAISQPTRPFASAPDAAPAQAPLAQPASQPASQPAPQPAQSPPRIDLRLDVTAASRSVMTLTLDICLTLTNRSDWAVRDLAVAARLDCVRAGDGQGAAGSPGHGQPLGEIGRIGPHQGTALTGQLRLPVSELSLIRQGSGGGRVYIPLVHVTIAAQGVPATDCTFVIGTPSSAGAGRIRPLPVTAPVGGIYGLAAQLVHVPQAPAATPQPA